MFPLVQRKSTQPYGTAIVMDETIACDVAKSRLRVTRPKLQKLFSPTKTENKIPEKTVIVWCCWQTTSFLANSDQARNVIIKIEKRILVVVLHGKRTYIERVFCSYRLGVEIVVFESVRVNFFFAAQICWNFIACICVCSFCRKSARTLEIP